MPVWLLAAETLATILGLFVFGSFKYQIHKNALTYGMLLVIVATFIGCRRRRGTRRSPSVERVAWIQHHVLTFAGLDDLIHADTMLFILGLTLFVVGHRANPASSRASRSSCCGAIGGAFSRPSSP